MQIIQDALKKVEDILPSLETVTMWRTPLEIEWFVAGRHSHPMQQFRQLVIELQIAISAVKSAEVNARRREAKRRLLEADMAAVDFDENEKRREARTALLQCDIDDIKVGEEQELRALRGKLQEIRIIHDLLLRKYSEFLKQSEEKQLKDGEAERWITHLARLASNELGAMGNLTSGTLDALISLPAEVKLEILARAFKSALLQGASAADLRNRMAMALGLAPLPNTTVAASAPAKIEHKA